MNKRYGHNISVNEYLNKTKNQTGGNLDNEDLTSKLLNFYKRESVLHEQGVISAAELEKAHISLINRKS